MRTLLRWSSRLKWLGLLGLPMFFPKQPVWKWLWLFWLFGILEIILSFPVFLQSLRQLAGIVICQAQNRPMPDKDNFLPRITYSLPFEGAWAIVNGGVSREASHSWEVNSQRYACDFLILDDSGKSCQGNPPAVTATTAMAEPCLRPRTAWWRKFAQTVRTAESSAEKPIL